MTTASMEIKETAAGASFERFAGGCAILAGLVHFLYAVAFVVINRSAPALGATLSALFLLLAGLLSMAALTGLYQHLRQGDNGFALWALLLGSIGTLGAAIHGGYDLANTLNPVAGYAADLPSQVDPRGLLTFGLVGVSLFIFAWLMGRQGQFSKNLVYAGYLLAALLVVIYLARLIILDPANPALLVPVLAAGFVVNPGWYIWIGLSLRREK